MIPRTCYARCYSGISQVALGTSQVAGVHRVNIVQPVMPVGDRNKNMKDQEKLQLEIERLNATYIELVYSPDSVDQIELIDHHSCLETTDLDVASTLQALSKLPDIAGSRAFWEAVVDLYTKKA